MSCTIDIDRNPPEILSEHGGERELWTALFGLADALSETAVEKAMAEVHPCAVGIIYGKGEYLVSRVWGPMDEAVVSCADLIRPIKPWLPEIIEVGLISHTDFERESAGEQRCEIQNVTLTVLSML